MSSFALLSLELEELEEDDELDEDEESSSSFSSSALPSVLPSAGDGAVACSSIILNKANSSSSFALPFVLPSAGCGGWDPDAAERNFDL